ncbi:cation transporter [Floricoccus tropicus]|uniref:Cation transporter n=1 Tax=Floricoccus tropicus TaxID=1859473 RepID=A0A1E8GJ03_9LACT|nr:cation diffusion facilitator family transporter [Floricoccus tropicus]OFI48250.1 cation transporter [Floricoccus tropicus]
MNNSRIKELKMAERGALISIVAYVVLSIIKIAVANVTNSESLRADGFNNITDIIGNIAVLAGIRMARRPADDDHAYGHWKVESVASLITSFIMFAVGFVVLRQTIIDIINNEKTAVDPVGAIVGIFSAIIMFGIYRYNAGLAQKVKSPGLMSAAKDNLSDAVTSIATSIAIVAASFNLTWIDRLMAVVITIFIFKTAYDIFSESAFSLSDGFDEEKIEEYKKALTGIREIEEIKNIRGRTYGSNVFLDVVVDMSPDMSVFESHQATEEIENILKTQFEVFDVDVHVEPSYLEEEERDSYIALDLLAMEEKILNGFELDKLLDRTFKEIQSDGIILDKSQRLIEKKPQQIGISQFNPERISKKTFILTYEYFENHQTYIVTSIWRRDRHWRCIQRQITKREL